MLATAHPAKFAEAVTQALANSTDFDFDRDVLPSEFIGLLDKERRVIDVAKADIDLVKEAIESIVGREAKMAHDGDGKLPATGL